MGTFLSASDEKTRRFAKSLAKMERYRIIGLTGELGSGKTTFTQGYAQGLGIKEKIISPTFVLIRQHKIPKATLSSPRKRGSINYLMDSPIKSENDRMMFYHIDLYRLEDLEEIKHLGIEDIIKDSNNIVIIEWAEKIEDRLPKDALKISLEVVDKAYRKIILNKEILF